MVLAAAPSSTGPGALALDFLVLAGAGALDIFFLFLEDDFLLDGAGAGISAGLLGGEAGAGVGAEGGGQVTGGSSATGGEATDGVALDLDAGAGSRIGGLPAGAMVAGVEIGGAAARVEVGGAAAGARVAAGVAAGRMGAAGADRPTRSKGSVDSQPLTLTHFMGQKWSPFGSLFGPVQRTVRLNRTIPNLTGTVTATSSPPSWGCCS